MDGYIPGLLDTSYNFIRPPAFIDLGYGSLAVPSDLPVIPEVREEGSQQSLPLANNIYSPPQAVSAQDNRPHAQRAVPQDSDFTFTVRLAQEADAQEQLRRSLLLVQQAETVRNYLMHEELEPPGVITAKSLAQEADAQEQLRRYLLLIQQVETDINNLLYAEQDRSVTISEKRLVGAVKDKTGVVTTHLIPLQQVARDHNCIIGIRPVERWATKLIKSGHPTKGLHIKGKSASWGAQAGLICVDQRFSKLESASANLIDKFNAQTRQCIEDGHAVAVPLVISGPRLSSLLQAGVLNNLSLENSKGVRSFTARGPSGQEYVFEAVRKSGLGGAFEIRHNGVPIEVLAPNADAKPLTADYDLLIIGPHLSDLGPQDNLPVPDVSHQLFRNRINRYQRIPANVGLLDSYLDPNSFYRRADAEIGNTPIRLRDMIRVINQALVGDGEPVVQHGADSGNPATDLDANYPATFALPAKIGHFDEICVIKNEEELVELVKQAKDSGYHMPLNPLWKNEVRSVRRESFITARSYLQANLKCRSRDPI